MARTMSVEVVTPAASIYNGEAEMVVATTTGGEVGILPLHIPIVAELAAGEIRLKNGGGDNDKVFATYGGYLQFAEDRMIVLTDNAVDVTEIDTAELESTVEGLNKRLESLAEDAIDDRAAIEHELAWTQSCIKTAKRHHA